MHATIADIRRGDRFTWAGRTYLAADDARPALGLPAADSRLYCDVATLPDKAKKSSDGLVHQGHYFVDNRAVRSDFAIDILHRGIPILLLWEEDWARTNPHPLNEPAGKAARRYLAWITDQRRAARRADDDTDITRDHAVRKALQFGVSAEEISEITALSQEQIDRIAPQRP